MSQIVRQKQIIDELQTALQAGSSEKRVSTLTRITDLFINTASNYGENETQLFGDVMGHLINHVESRALIELSQRLALVANAPDAIVQSLARHDAIEISGPVLTACKRLSDDDLIEIAKTKSQAHLAKIAGRAQLNEAVTDVLVDHGDADVANKVAGNAGAQFSRIGMAKLVMRASGDDRLTESMSRRADIPPVLFRRTLSQATEAVRKRLLASAAPSYRDMIQKVLDDIAVQVGKHAARPRNYAEAQRAVAEFSQDTELAKSKLLFFASSNRVVETVAALSVLSGVPVDQIDELFSTANEFALMVLCKASVLDLDTAYAVNLAAIGKPTSADTQDFDDFRQQYYELSIPSAQRVIRFWQGRQKIKQHFSSGEAKAAR
jgi:uncharacterized protein (DUF2336 family)